MREKAKDLLGDFQAVVGGWPTSLSWEPASTRTFGHYRCILRRKSEAGGRPLPRSSPPAPMPDNWTRIAVGTAGVRHMELGIYPPPLVPLGSPVFPPRHPSLGPRIRSAGPLPGVFPLSLGPWSPGRLSLRRGQVWRNVRFGWGLGRRCWDHTDLLHDLTEKLRR
jgi:hypothetical protein